MTVLQNIMLAPVQVLKQNPEEVRARAVELLAKVRLTGKESAWPGHLSGGQQQRVAIARALAMRPSVMLFDEVTAALDPETVKEVLATIRELVDDGMTCILVTHEMRFAREVAHQVYFTDKGVIVEHGPPAAFFDAPQDARTREFLGMCCDGAVFSENIGKQTPLLQCGPPQPHTPTMDPCVLAALQRWPDVPAVVGWLSLDARGRWRLHAEGGAHRQPNPPGELIGNAGLRAFIDRNYGCDARGRWFFQNGPQRVYVRLDAAPYIVRLGDDATALYTHTGQPVDGVTEWLVDDLGNLYINSAIGAGRVDDRDLAALLARLLDANGSTLLDALERGADSGMLSYCGLAPAPWRRIVAADIPAQLGFIVNPSAERLPTPPLR